MFSVVQFRSPLEILTYLNRLNTHKAAINLQHVKCNTVKLEILGCDYFL